MILVGTETFEFLAKVNVFNTAIGLVQVKEGSVIIGNEKGGVSNIPLPAG